MTKLNFNVVIEVGLVKQTEKAVLVSFWTSANQRGFKVGERYEVITAWLPKSQVNLLERKDRSTTYRTYHNLRTNHMGLISEGTVKTNLVKETVKIELPSWLYQKSMGYGFDI